MRFKGKPCQVWTYKVFPRFLVKNHFRALSTQTPAVHRWKMARGLSTRRGIIPSGREAASSSPFTVQQTFHPRASSSPAMALGLSEYPRP